jgi:NADPH:quinone reductase-like Zn-dependent oxidoreductase
VKLVEGGHFNPLIDRIYPLSDIVAAHAHVDTGHKKGSVVVSVVSEHPVKRSAA